MVYNDIINRGDRSNETLGTATDYRGWDVPDEQDYEADDPRHWRNKCEGRTLRLQDFLAEWKNRFMNLEWICVPSNRWQLWWEGNAGEEGLKELNVRFHHSILLRLKNHLMLSRSYEKSFDHMGGLTISIENRARQHSRNGMIIIYDIP